MCSYSLSSDMRLSMQQDDSRLVSGTATLSFCPGDTLCKRIHISTRAVGRRESLIQTGVRGANLLQSRLAPIPAGMLPSLA
jgi:hypothetical protein